MCIIVQFMHGPMLNSQYNILYLQSELNKIVYGNTLLNYTLKLYEIMSHRFGFQRVWLAPNANNYDLYGFQVFGTELNAKNCDYSLCLLYIYIHQITFCLLIYSFSLLFLSVYFKSDFSLFLHHGKPFTNFDKEIENWLQLRPW